MDATRLHHEDITAGEMGDSCFETSTDKDLWPVYLLEPLKLVCKK